MDRVRLPLFLLRIGVFIVMLMWTLDKFVRPGHAAGIFKKFYGIDGVSPTVFYVFGALELLLLVGFVTGTAKRYTYGLVLLLHAISTLSSYQQYLAPRLQDRKSTRLNSSHGSISYAVFCLKKKNAEDYRSARYRCCIARVR